jgi:uridine kinase
MRAAQRRRRWQWRRRFHLVGIPGRELPPIQAAAVAGGDDGGRDMANESGGVTVPAYSASSIDDIADTIVSARLALSPHRALLVGISGIDWSGKSFVATQLEKHLRSLGWNVAALSADDWHSVANIRNNPNNPAEHFYEHALRLSEMFEHLVIPLRDRVALDLTADYCDAKAAKFRKKRYQFSDVDIVLLEGIFLFKRAYRDHFNVKVWIDCSFATALRRATLRVQEGLSPAETERAFETIFFPAQRLHLQRDQPREHADIIFDNEDL